jgi:Tfp pilus assembly protein PilF
MKSNLSKDKSVLLICLFLVIAPLAVFWQLGSADFISYDDRDYVTENIHIRHGITPAAIEWAFRTDHAANWHPLTWMSHMLDVQAFGSNPHRHHMVNLLFHVANTLLLFLVLYRMTGALWKCAFVAAAFALHPLHVESVAWVSERKDVLSTFFWMLTTAAYVRYVELQRLRAYLIVLAFFALGLMAKPMLVTLPFTLLLLDYWPLQRIPFPWAGGKSTIGSRKKLEPAAEPPSPLPIQPVPRTSYLLVEKIPFFFLAAVSCVVTFIAQRNGGAIRSFESFPLGVRIANAVVSYAVYMEKTIWPGGLAVFYPHPGLRPLWQIFAAGLLLAIITCIALRKAAKIPFLAVGWLWFVGTLVPVIGIVQVGSQAWADRYTYVPLVGLFIMIAWGLPVLLKGFRRAGEALFAMAVVALAAASVCTWIQVGYWHDSLTLFNHAIQVTGRNAVAYYNRGMAYIKLADYRQAISDCNRAVEINPKYSDAYNNRAIAYMKLGDYGNAVSDYTRIIEMDKNYAKAYLNRGSAYAGLGDFRQAVSDYTRAIEIDPAYADPYSNRGVAYIKLGENQQALSDYDRAIEIDPENADVYYNRGLAYGKQGDPQHAVEDLQKAARLNSEPAKNYLRRMGISW